MKLPGGKKLSLGPGDYWHIGPLYIWKWLVLAVLGSASLIVLGMFGLPDGLFRPLSTLPPLYRYDDPVLRAVSGVVRIEDAAGRVRYVGEVVQGACTGMGKLYDTDGRLCYDGPLVDGICEGTDARVYSAGQLIYRGDMVDGLYEGQGRRTDPETGVVSEGQFVRGRLEGEGREYDADGALLREGTFARDLLNGEGREYAPSGGLLREGTFSDGLLYGTGREYTQSGTLVYEGEFRRGVRQGTGKLYHTQYRTLSYEGEFVDGEPMGRGKLYHPSGQLLYEGEVCSASPRADAFLSLSLAEVEQAFTQHWQIYTWENVTAFVYPYFQLMFLTESPVAFTSAAEETEGERGAESLSPDIDHGSIVITQVLSYGRALPGVPQPETGQSSGTHKSGWREWFSEYALGGSPEGLKGVVVIQTGPFVYRFLALDAAGEAQVNETLAVDALLETVTAWKEEKDWTVWYQTAEWRDVS